MNQPNYHYRHESYQKPRRSPIGQVYDVLMLEPAPPEGVIVPAGGIFTPRNFIRQREIWDHIGGQMLECIVFLHDDRLVHQYHVKAIHPERDFRTLETIRAYIGDIGIGGYGALPLALTEDGQLVNESNDPLVCVDKTSLAAVRELTKFPEELLEFVRL